MGTLHCTKSCSSHLYHGSFVRWCGGAEYGLMLAFSSSMFHCCLRQASHFPADFEQRVFAVALTDSPVSVYGRRMKKKVLTMLKQVCPTLHGSWKFTLRRFPFRKRSTGWLIVQRWTQTSARMIAVSYAQQVSDSRDTMPFATVPTIFRSSCP